MSFNSHTTKKILLLIPNFGSGGAQRVFSQHTDFLNKKYRVVQGVFNLKAVNLYSTNTDIPVVTLEVPAGKNILQKIYFFFLRLVRLSRYKKEIQPDITISHLEGADLINVLTGRKEHKIIVLHGSKRADVKYKGIYHFFRHNVLNPLVLKRASHIVSVSEGIRQEVMTLYRANPKKISVIYNFFDIERVQKCSEGDLTDKRFNEIYERYDVLINCARLDIQKNQKGLLDVYSKIRQARKDSKLFLLGDGSDRDTLVEYARELGLKVYLHWDNEMLLTEQYDVYFIGNVENPFPFIKKSKLFLLTSGWEGFPLALGEAMICGTPVVSTECPTGPRELLAPDTALTYTLRVAEYASYGVLMPLLDRGQREYQTSCEVWKETVLSLLNDSVLRAQYSAQGLLRMQDFSREKIIEKWFGLIEKMDENK
jgi:glycosyltransferase involved in cell wall biosynthesis